VCPSRAARIVGWRLCATSGGLSEPLFWPPPSNQTSTLSPGLVPVTVPRITWYQRAAGLYFSPPFHSVVVALRVAPPLILYLTVTAPRARLASTCTGCGSP